MTLDQHSAQSASRQQSEVIWLNDIRSSRRPPALAGFLRQGTRNLCDRREAYFNKLDFTRLENYAAFLRGEAEALLPLEAAIERNNIEAILPDWRLRRRSTSLSHDLWMLDVVCDPLPTPRLLGPGDVLGVCYALEASRMAARIVLARLAAATSGQTDRAAMSATSFLRHGNGQRFWPSFIDALERHPDAQAHPGEILRAAQMAFGMFESARGLTRPSHAQTA